MRHRSPTKQRMYGIADMIRCELKKDQTAGRWSPLQLQLTRESWRLIRMALNKASKP